MTKKSTGDRLPGMDRRKFLSATGGGLMVVALPGCGGGNDVGSNSNGGGSGSGEKGVRLLFDAENAQVAYAAKRLEQALAQQNLGQNKFDITLKLSPSELGAEAFAIAPGQQSLTISGGDGRGVIYGALSFITQLRNGTALSATRPESGTPALAFRAIKHNLPWDSYRSSSALDQHYDTVRDVAYWEKFLDMMVENRFNALTLWNLHPYPYMIRPKNFPEASPFTEAEFAQWKALYQAIFRMAKERGIETYVVHWNILVSASFAKAHGLTKTNFYPYYRGEGDTSDLVARYNRENVTQMLEEYPDLTGFGFTFGEQMEGMTPEQRQQWINDVMIAGMRNVKRPVKMIFRMPQSAEANIGGSTSVATEQLTRASVEALGAEFPSPIWVEFKFNWSHGHSTTQLVKIHGGPLTDTFFTPKPQNYKVTWMVRNEDFFALRWGVPSFVREHILKNGTQDYVGGYFVGSETYIPAKDYFTALTDPVDWKYAFERQWLFYKLWGRLLYDPKTPDSVFEAEFVARYGSPTKSLLGAYEKASATPLRYATSIDFSSDTIIYSEGMMAYHPTKGSEPITVDRMIGVKPLRTDWLSIKSFVAAQVAGSPIPPGTMTPILLAEQLEADNAEALRMVQDIDVSKSASLRYEVADVKAWANLGLYYAAKLRGAVAVHAYRTVGGEQNKQAAVANLDKCLGYWDEVVKITRPLYKDMPLVHYNPLGNNSRNDNNLFHWALVRGEIANDIQAVKGTLP